jgi:putative MATE family efflux protein
LIVAACLALIGAPLAPKLLGLMGASPSVIEHGAGFTRIMLAGNATVVMLFMINAIFRGAGDAAIAMRVLWLANALNILLGPCFIFGLGPFPKLGIAGAAVATNIGRGTGALYAFSRLVRKGGRFEIKRHHFRLEPAIMTRLVRLSATGTFQVFIGMASWIGLVRTISSFGTDVVAGYIVGIRVILFALLPSWGMSNAAATMVGQALGAKKPERAERAVWKAGFYNVIFLGSVGLIFVLFARQIIGLFTHDPNVVPYGVDCLRIVASGFLFYAYGMVLTQSFNGAGDTWTPTIINLFVFWLWELPLAYVLAIVLGIGPRGVFLAITIAFSTLAVVSALVFRRGRWKTKLV